MSRWSSLSDRVTSRRRVSRMGLTVVVLATAVLLSGVSFVALGCGGEEAGPEATVQKFLTAMGNQDIEAMVTITGGSMTVGGLTLDLAQAGEIGFPAEYSLSKVDGQWYIVDME